MPDEFTPGPWKIVTPPSDQDYTLQIWAENSPEEQRKYPNSEGKWIGSFRLYGSLEERDANARLCVRSPEMYAMLQEVLAFSHLSTYAYRQKYPHARGTRKDLNERIRALLAQIKEGGIETGSAR